MDSGNRIPPMAAIRSRRSSLCMLRLRLVIHQSRAGNKTHSRKHGSLSRRCDVTRSAPWPPKVEIEMISIDVTWGSTGMGLAVSSRQPQAHISSPQEPWAAVQPRSPSVNRTSYNEYDGVHPRSPWTGSCPLGQSWCRTRVGLGENPHVLGGAVRQRIHCRSRQTEGADRGDTISPDLPRYTWAARRDAQAKPAPMARSSRGMRGGGMSGEGPGSPFGGRPGSLRCVNRLSRPAPAPSVAPADIPAVRAHRPRPQGRR